MVKGDDGEMMEVEIISTHEKQSMFQKSAPIMHPIIAFFFGFLNLVPGLGTFLASFTLICCGRSSFETNMEGLLVGIGTAFLQLVLAPLVIGWFWSLQHGVYFVKQAHKARDEKEEKKKKSPA